MKNKFTILISVSLSVVLTTAINLGIPAVKGMKAFEPVATSLGTAFTYQGRLEKNGQPVTGVTCSSQFGLYDVDTGGSPLGSGILTTDRELTNGLFTTSLDFGAAFNGDARWLEIAAQCPDDVSYTTIGRQLLTATPYALYAKKVELVTKTGYISINSGDFQPTKDGSDYWSTELRLAPDSVPADQYNRWYITGVSLPHGSTITGVTFYWYDSEPINDVGLWLIRNNHNGSASIMANGLSSGEAGSGNTAISSIYYNNIDNSQYSYQLLCYLYDSSTQLRGVIITYTYLSPG